MADELQQKTVLLVDDDSTLIALLELVYARAGARTISTACGEDALETLTTQHADLVILDIMMPALDGIEVCRRIRQRSAVPIIFLSALDGEETIVRGLDCGAVDYMVKPFSAKVLLARSRAALRRAGEANGTAPAIFDDGYLRIDLQERQVQVEGRDVALTPREFQILAYLFRNAGHVLTYEQIVEEVWGWDGTGSAKAIHVNICRLRRKIERDPDAPHYLLNEHGVGYTFGKPANHRTPPANTVQ